MHLIKWLLSLGLLKNEIYLSATTCSFQPSFQHGCAYCTHVHKEHITHIYLQDLNPHIHGIAVPECPEGISSIRPSIMDLRVHVSATGSDQQGTTADAQILSPDVLSIYFPHNHFTIYEVSDLAVPWPFAAPMVTHERLCKRFDHLVAGCTSHQGLCLYGDEDHSIESSMHFLKPLVFGCRISVTLNNVWDWLIPRKAFSLAPMVSTAWNSLIFLYEIDHCTIFWPRSSHGMTPTTTLVCVCLICLCAYVIWRLWAYMQSERERAMQRDAYRQLILVGAQCRGVLGGVLTMVAHKISTPTSSAASVQGMVQHALAPRLQAHECVACMDALADVLLQPCNHLCLCSACSEQLRDIQPGELPVLFAEVK